MKKSIRALLTDDEAELVSATEAHPLKRLDEDELLELLQRVRRARNKYSKLHRRQASSQVSADGGRGKAAERNNRTSQKAEVFEEALERVSAQLAKSAAQSAARLREERLARASNRNQGGGGRTAGAGKAAGTPKRRATTASPREVKIAASGRAAGARRQAARDARG
jgi:hypothetical protein